jgi:hypothetical protein
MGIRSIVSRPLAKWVDANTKAWSMQAVQTQQRVFQNLMHGAKDTVFGNDHGFASIRSHTEFVARVPIRDYEGLDPTWSAW